MGVFEREKTGQKLSCKYVKLQFGRYIRRKLYRYSLSNHKGGRNITIQINNEFKI